MFSKLIDEAIFQVIKLNRIYSTRIVVAVITERSCNGVDNYNANKSKTER